MTFKTVDEFFSSRLTHRTAISPFCEHNAA